MGVEWEGDDVWLSGAVEADVAAAISGWTHARISYQ